MKIARPVSALELTRVTPIGCRCWILAAANQRRVAQLAGGIKSLSA